MLDHVCFRPQVLRRTTIRFAILQVRSFLFTMVLNPSTHASSLPTATRNNLLEQSRSVFRLDDSETTSTTFVACASEPYLSFLRDPIIWATVTPRPTQRANYAARTCSSSSCDPRFQWVESKSLFQPAVHAAPMADASRCRRRPCTGLSHSRVTYRLSH